MWYLGVNLAVSQSQHAVSFMKSYCIINCDLHIICIMFVCLTIVYLHISIYNLCFMLIHVKLMKSIVSDSYILVTVMSYYCELTLV